MEALNWRSVGLLVSCSRMTRASMAKRSRCSNCSMRETIWSSMALVKVTLCVDRINFMPLECNFIPAKSSESEEMSTEDFCRECRGIWQMGGKCFKRETGIECNQEHSR